MSVPFPRPVLVAWTALLLVPLGTTAAVRTWNGGGTNSFWSNPTNWSGHIVPSPGDDLVFPDAALRRSNENDLPAGMVFASITISAENYTLAGNAVSLLAGITNNGPYRAFITLPVRLEADQTFSVGANSATSFLDSGIDLNGFDLTLHGFHEIYAPIAGAGSLTKRGSGTLTLAGTNTYSGVTRILEGWVFVQKSRGLGDPSRGTEVATGARLLLETSVGEPLVLQNGAEVTSLSSHVTLSSPVTLSGGRSRLSGDTPLTINGVIDGTGSLEINFHAALTLNANNTYAGTNHVGSGTCYVNGQQPGSDVFLERFALLGGLGRVGEIICADGRINPGTNGPGILTCRGVSLSGNGTFVVEIDGAATGNGHDQLRVLGAVSITNALLVVSNSFVPSGGAEFVVIDNDGADPVIGNFGGLPEGGVIAGVGVAFRVSYVGGSGNDVVVTAIERPPAPTGIVRVWSGGGVNSLWTSPENWVGQMAPNEGDDLEFPSGAARLASLNDFPAGYSLNSLRFSGSGYSLQGAEITLNAGILDTHSAGVNEVLLPLRATTNQTFTSTVGSLRLLSEVDTAGWRLAFDGGGEIQAASLIEGSGSILKTGSGLLSLTGTNTYFGPTEVTEGSLAISNALALGESTFGTMIGSNATLLLQSGGIRAEPLTLLGTLISAGGAGAETNVIAARITLSFLANARIVVSNALTVNAPISGSGGFSKLGAGLLTLNATNSYNRDALLLEGALEVNGALPYLQMANGILGGTGVVSTLTAYLSGAPKVISPGFDGPGILTVYNTALAASTILTIQLNGNEPGVNSDLLRVHDSVSLNNPTLDLSLGFVPEIGDRFTLIEVTSGYPIDAGFTGLREGAVFLLNGLQFQITYRGGDGNDVVLTVTNGLPVTSVWSGRGADGFWSTPENWLGHAAPSPGDDLVFPSGASRLTSTNDFPADTRFNSIVFEGFNHRLHGAPVVLQTSALATNAGTIFFPLTLAGNATFGSSAAGAGATPGLDINGDVDLGSHDLTVTGSGKTRLRGQLKSGNLIKSGSGVAELHTNNNHTMTHVLQGDLVLYHTNALGAPDTPTIVAAGARLTFGRSGLEISEPLILSGTLASHVPGLLLSNRWSGEIQLAGNAIISSTNTLQIDGPISGTGNLTKDGTGRLLLTGNNSYAGPTIVSNGWLVVSGDQPASDIILRGGVLRGNGRVGQITGTNGGFFVNPGVMTTPLLDDTAILSCSNLVLSGFVSRLNFDLNGPIFGTAYDQLKVSGTVSLNGPRLDVFIRFAPNIGDTFVLINNDGTDPVFGTFRGLPEASHLTQSTRLFQISYAGGDGNDVTLTRVTVPPSSIHQLQWDGGGSPLLTGAGISNLNYIIEFAPNLSPPIIWTAIATNAASTNGVYEFLDPERPTNSSRFYRVRSP